MKAWIIVMFLLFLLPSEVLATPPQPPPCYEVENPDFYIELVQNSKQINYFKDLELQNVSVPCTYQHGTADVILEFRVPSLYSPNGLDYYLTTRFSYSGDNLTNSEELRQLFENLRLNIESFESDERIKFFIEATGLRNASYSQSKISLEISKRERLEYDLLEENITEFSFDNILLIEKLDLFLPNINNISQIEEFKNNSGIMRAEYDSYNNGRLSIYEESRCPRCDDYMIIDVNMEFPATSWNYMLDNDYEWNTFPEMMRAHEIIRDNLLIGDLSNCTIGTGSNHDYTIVRGSPTHRWSITVALKCAEVAGWKDAFVALYPDGTYDSLRIAMDYHPNEPTNPWKSKSACGPTLITALALIPLFSIRRWRN